MVLTAFSWRSWWLLFTVIWVAVTGIQAATILAFSDEQEKVLRPILVGVAVPAVLYILGMVWQRLKKKRDSA